METKVNVPNEISLQQTQLPAAIEKALIEGDLSGLTVEQRVQYYNKLCDTIGLNPMTKPFDYIKFQGGKLTLYANKNCAEQLRDLKNLSISIVARERIDDVYVVTARAVLPSGRGDESTGVVTIGRLSGDALANALMKAETKAKRRVTLSACSLGLLDETEIETIPNAIKVTEAGTPVSTKKALEMTVEVKAEKSDTKPLPEKPGDWIIEGRRRLKYTGTAIKDVPEDDEIWLHNCVSDKEKSVHMTEKDLKMIRAYLDAKEREFFDAAGKALAESVKALDPKDTDKTRF